MDFFDKTGPMAVGIRLRMLSGAVSKEAVRICALGGVALMFMQGAAPGLCVCGAGLVSFALGLLLIAPMKAADKGLWKLTKAFGRGCKRLIVGKRRNG